jgi:glutathione S-transferase
MSQRLLYDLAGADPERRFSPYCWRIKLALAHKGLEVTTIPWRFTDKDAIAQSGQDKVPVLVDGARVVSDSWAIAVYLEETYPDAPSLFGGPQAMAVTRFLSLWTDRVMGAGLVRMIVGDVYAHLHEKDLAYFRASREARFGMPLEEVGADRETAVVAFRQALDPLRALVGEQPFVGGQAPTYADYLPFSILQWAANVSSFALLADDDPLIAWRERVADLYDGLARKALIPTLV